MGGKMARGKGQRGEREVIAMLQPIVDQVLIELGLWTGVGTSPIVLKRNLMQSMEGGCDMVGLEWMSLEVKRVENLSGIGGWWRQTLRQAGSDKTPVLIYRPNHQRWKVRMRVPVAVPRADRKPVLILSTVNVDIQTFLVYFKQRLKEELRSK